MKSHPKLKRPTGPLIIRNRYQRERVITQIVGESRTQAGNGNDTDVNRIMERFTRTGILPQPTQQPQYADVTDLQQDLQEILRKGDEAKLKYEELKLQAEKRKNEITTQQQNEKAQKADTEQLEQTT